jgi:hypothetical protein
MIVRALKPEGLERFGRYLVDLKETPSLPPPVDLLENPTFTEPIERGAEVASRAFATKLEAAQYLNSALGAIPDRSLRTNAGLWGWLTLFYFDQVCPANSRGQRKRLSIEKYSPSTTDHRRGFDKHLLFFPWKMWKIHKEYARHILAGELHVDSKIQREWTSYTYNVCTQLVKIGDILYFDIDKGRLKHGATGKRSSSLRFLTRLFNQLDLTYDLWGMKAEEILPLLPRGQFERFLPPVKSA